MGTGNSKASIAIQVGSTVLIPGTMISGKIYLNVTADRVDGEDLVVRLTGSEFALVRWTTTTRDSKGHTHRHRNSSSTTSTFLDMPFVLSTVPIGYFVRGQYEFPFQFMIPPGVLPSMNAILYGDEGGDCSVNYRLEARLHRKGWMKWDVKSHISLQVLATPIPLTLCPAYVPPEEQDVQFCCCYKRGTVTAGMYTASALLQPGQTCTFSYVLQNNSFTRMKAIELNLLETVTWHCGGKYRSTVTRILHQRIEGKSLPPQLIHTVKERQVLPAEMLPTIEALKQILDTNQYVCQGQVSTTARYTMNGQLITVTHTLVMKVCTPFGNNNPQIDYPMTIYSVPNLTQAPPMTNTIIDMHGHVITTPMDWQPSHVAPEVTLPLPKYQKPVEGDIDEVDIDFITHTASSHATQLQQKQQSIDTLYHALQHTYSVVQVMKEWLAHTSNTTDHHTTDTVNNVNTLTPEQLGKIYSLISGVLDQLQITDMLVMARSTITCDHIVAIAYHANTLIKTQVISKWAVKCIDKKNHTKLESVLSSFDYMCVTKDFV